MQADETAWLPVLPRHTRGSTARTSGHLDVRCRLDSVNSRTGGGYNGTFAGTKVHDIAFTNWRVSAI
jgi:hypothetical protein